MSQLRTTWNPTAVIGFIVGIILGVIAFLMFTSGQPYAALGILPAIFSFGLLCVGGGNMRQTDLY